MLLYCTLILHYIIRDFQISKRFVFFCCGHFPYLRHLLFLDITPCFILIATIADKAAVSSGVVQSAVRNYINLNIGEQLGRPLLLLRTPPSLKITPLKK